MAREIPGATHLPDRSRRPDAARARGPDRGGGAAAVPRAPDLSVDLEARRHRLRRDERPRPRVCARSSPAAVPDRHANDRAPRTSDDGTQKLVLALADGRQIECVYIPDTPAQTFCVSTQVGCAMALRLLPHRQDGPRAASDRGRDCRSGARARARHGTARRAVQHRADGHGRAAAQLRRHHGGAGDAQRRSTGSPCRPAASRCPRSASCR